MLINSVPKDIYALKKANPKAYTVCYLYKWKNFTEAQHKLRELKR